MWLVVNWVFCEIVDEGVGVSFKIWRGRGRGSIHLEFRKGVDYTLACSHVQLWRTVRDLEIQHREHFSRRRHQAECVIEPSTPASWYVCRGSRQLICIEYQLTMAGLLTRNSLLGREAGEGSHCLIPTINSCRTCS